MLEKIAYTSIQMLFFDSAYLSYETHTCDLQLFHWNVSKLILSEYFGGSYVLAEGREKNKDNTIIIWQTLNGITYHSSCLAFVCTIRGEYFTHEILVGVLFLIQWYNYHILNPTILSLLSLWCDLRSIYQTIYYRFNRTIFSQLNSRLSFSIFLPGQIARVFTVHT